MKRRLLYSALIGLIVCLAACAIQNKRSGYYYKGVRTDLSNAVVIFPIEKKNRTVYVTVTNHTGAKSLNGVKPLLLKGLQARGYRIVHQKSKANLVLDADIVLAAGADLNTAHDILRSGYGGELFLAGTDLLGSKQLHKLVAKSPPMYVVVTDLMVLQRKMSRVDMGSMHMPISKHDNRQWFQNPTRLVSDYSYEVYPPKFNEIQPAFNISIANVIQSMF